LRSALTAGAALLLLSACSSSGANHATSTTTTTTGAPATRTTTTVPRRSTIAWSELQNPLFGEPEHAVKDPALVAVNGGWVLLFSQVDTHGSWRVGIARSHDLTEWTAAPALPRDPTTEGEASPDVVREPNGTFVVTYQSFVHDRAGGQAKLYARTTTDFTTFSAPIRLLANVLAAPADRLIDPALVYSPAGLLLGFKVGTTDAGSVQHFEIARSATGTLAGPWTVIGRPDISVYGDTVENYEFLTVGGKPALLATSNVLDRPQLFRLAGAPGLASGWLHWSPAREVVVPQESWNPGKGVSGSDFEHANCAFLIGGGAQIGGYSYLVYGDSPSLTTFGGAGHAQFGLVRSTDLIHWSVPPR
jgi:hypothetical protein